MSERIISQYQPLFEVQILHHYWLDEGETLFDVLPVATYNRHLLAYDVRKFLSVTPTKTTKNYLTSLGCLFKQTTSGFIVLMAKKSASENADNQATISIFDHLMLEFIITISNSDFFNYTALTLKPQSIIAFQHKTKNEIYRYKTNVPVFSNKTGTLKQKLFLSKAIPEISNQTPKDTIESLFEDNNALVQLISDDASAVKHTLYQGTTHFPIFVNQNDIPEINLPDELIKPVNSEPECGILLLNEIPDDIFALIQLSMRTENNDSFDLIDEHEQAKTASPIFHIRFKNRSSHWHYYNKAIGKTELIPAFDPNTLPLPLTFFGNAYPNDNPDEKKQKPTDGFIKAELINNDPNKVRRLISDIFE